VIAFHLSPALAPGGFVGVDVFFVISGYLMTRIILGRLGAGRFSLLGFYLDRLRRIWPALVVLCAVLLAAGAVALDPWSYQRLAADIPEALAFVSNATFAGRVGYFAPSEAGTWLLHTWSLSVEWQFYLAYPLLLMALNLRPAVRRWAFVVVAGLAAVSLGDALTLWSRSSATSFYALTSRAWELLAGALALAAERRWRPGAVTRAAAHGAGLALIAAGALLADPAPGWPSPVALLPVGGAALVIAAGLGEAAWARLAPVSLVGRASYSIYLWHWPVIVAARYAGLPLTAPLAMAEIVLMLALGLASYGIVERTLTPLVFRADWRRWAPALAATAALVALAVAAQQTRGFEAMRTAALPAPTRALLGDDRAAADDWAYPGVCDGGAATGPLRRCVVGDPAARQVLVIGDSHAEQFVARYAGRHPADAGATFVTHDGCLPIPGVGAVRAGAVCPAWMLAAFAFAERAGFARVVIMGNWAAYLEERERGGRGGLCAADASGCPLVGSRPLSLAQALDRLAAEIRRLEARGVAVTLIGPQPRSQAAQPRVRYQQQFFGQPTASWQPAAEIAAAEAATRSQLLRVARETGATLVDPLQGFCPAGRCPLVDGASRGLYRDSGHFRASAVAQPAFAYLDPWLAPPPSPAAPVAAPMRLK
jgi:peptidoglycan/LPS O-acetylase OafA/YrhL